MHKLVDLAAALEYQSKQTSSYIKFKDGKSRLLKFFPEKTEITQVTYRCSKMGDEIQEKGREE